MVLIEYFGKSMGSQSWYGATTGKQYEFGLARHKIQPVDPKDLRTNKNNQPGLLEIRESGIQIFKVVKNQAKMKGQPPVPAKTLEVPKVEVSPSPAEDAAFQQLPEGAEIGEVTKVLVENPKVLDISLAAKKLADEMGISQVDVEGYITGTGLNGKVTVKDIRKHGAIA